MNTEQSIKELFYIDGIQYYPFYNEETRENCVAVIRKLGGYSGDVVIPGSIRCAGRRYAVKAVLEYAFAQSVNLTSVTFKKGIESIGENAFEGCTALIVVKLPNGIKEIGSKAFLNCSSLADITLPKGPIHVGSMVFEGTDYLKNVSEGLIYNGTCLLGYKGELPSKITVKKNTTVIANEALAYAKEISEVVLPEGLEIIGNAAFHNCTSLVEINIPESLQDIDIMAFDDCKNLSKIVLPHNLTHIGSNAFTRTAYWENLPEGLVYNGSCLLGYKGLCPKDLKVKTGTTLIADDSFDNVKFRTVKFNDELKTIGNMAFFYADIKNLDLPSSLEYIGIDAFARCNNIKTITYPKHLKTIDVSPFYFYSSLKTITFCSAEPPVATDCSSIYFSDVPLHNRNVTLLVPKGSKEAYLKADYWGEYFFTIEEYEL